MGNRAPPEPAGFVYVSSGRVVAALSFGGLISPFDDGLREQLTGKVIRRLQSGPR